MISLRILVLEDRLPRRKAIAQALTVLGVRAVFQAGECEKALDLITRAEGVDIVICDLSNEKLGYFDFLMLAGRARLVNALILGATLEPQFLRAVECINQFSQLKLIGVMGVVAPVQDLSTILRDYIKHKTFSPLLVTDSFKLPTEPEVRNGLEAREFKAWFQPKFDLRTGALCGVEALARWEHPTRGLLLPGEFLPAVLAYDLIDDMFKQVFAQGLDLLVALRGRNITLQVAFNLHASQLARFDLALYIENALIEHDLPGSALMFELAENGLLDMPVATQKSLLCLRLLGCGLSIDDFGTGFSSLTLLCQLPFQELKLDSSVVQDLSDLHSRAMMISTIALARALEISLVIEGVSSQEIRDQALAMGGTFAQGFHLAKPMSARRLKEWLE
ncbi:EAL domain-containing protein [Pseudomonas sp. TH32]|jgi:EAL domain-containing protein (putative c-di-GMP-specific phosphodiesterase class I)|uniref:EAL domain-containing response regulator n=1 Tax=Pseudomonas sp. TH32 TaxID=2796397 RepID=UPI001913C4B3|nr:EAL domain-containing protein [Pseudomonas sp. TH32]MBK5437660.1 EAL domain-containing protein [Pseudomonas sp. TH32]